VVEKKELEKGDQKITIFWEDEKHKIIEVPIVPKKFSSIILMKSIKIISKKWVLKTDKMVHQRITCSTTVKND